jgi:hypothetical protein
VNNRAWLILKWIFALYLAFLLASLFSETVAERVFSPKPLPDSYYVAAAGVSAVLLIAAVLAAERLVSGLEKYFGKAPASVWVFVLGTILILAAAVLVSLHELQLCHPEGRGTSGSPVVCGTSQGHAVVSLSTSFGLGLLVAQACIALIAAYTEAHRPQTAVPVTGTQADLVRTPGTGRSATEC